MSDRIFAIGCVAVSALIIVQMWTLDIPIAYEPVGPRAFPVLLALLMVACCISLFVSPDQGIQWPDRKLLAKGGILIALLLAYASLFESLGFPLATSIMVVVASRLFGGGIARSLGFGVPIGVLGSLLFDRVLQVSLPLGRIWG